jgi:hypothetical protein
MDVPPKIPNNDHKTFCAFGFLQVISKTSRVRHTCTCARCKYCERSEAFSQEISLENKVRDCFVGKNTLLAMTEKCFEDKFYLFL